MLQAANGAPVYVLGISHVSKESCQQIEQLIRLVQPGEAMPQLVQRATWGRLEHVRRSPAQMPACKASRGCSSIPVLQTSSWWR